MRPLSALKKAVVPTPPPSGLSMTENIFETASRLARIRSSMYRHPQSWHCAVSNLTQKHSTRLCGSRDTVSPGDIIDTPIRVGETAEAELKRPRFIQIPTGGPDAARNKILEYRLEGSLSQSACELPKAIRMPTFLDFVNSTVLRFEHHVAGYLHYLLLLSTDRCSGLTTVRRPYLECPLSVRSTR